MVLLVVDWIFFRFEFVQFIIICWGLSRVHGFFQQSVEKGLLTGFGLFQMGSGHFSWYDLNLMTIALTTALQSRT